MRLFFVFLLLLLGACAKAPPQVDSSNPLSCIADADCVCGGVDARTGDCFVGNRAYAEHFVDFSRDCPDFCTGIAGHLETRCVDNTCRNVPRMKGGPVACTEEAKLCPDGSAVGRVPPSCEFAPCPEPLKEPEDPSSAHWLCENGSWRQNPEQCFENSCLNKDDCQLLGVKGICGPYKIVAPKSVHKAPVFYESRCGKEPCGVMTAMCIDPRSVQPIRNADCRQGRCVAVTDEPRKECDSAEDCVKNACCHATTCVPKSAKPDCEGIFCTMECKPGSLDCGGSCGCAEGKCVGIPAEFA